MIQGSEEWRLLRAGKITGSRFRAVMDLNKRTGLPNKPRRDLVQALRMELMTGQPDYVEPNEYMAHGSRCEPIACATYEFLHDCRVEHVAWIQHPTLAYVGFSPDGLLGDDGLIEIKSPALEPRHMRTVESGKCPDDYIAQVLGGLWVSGRKWAKFVSFWEPTHDLCVVHVERDEQYIKRLADECAAVWNEVNQQSEAAA